MAESELNNNPVTMIYDVRLSTPVGKRKGIMTVHKEHGRVYGTLDILGHSESFEGCLSSEGSCIITGTVKTLMRTINYIASGFINDSELSLTVTDKNSGTAYSLDGIPRKVISTKEMNSF